MSNYSRSCRFQVATSTLSLFATAEQLFKTLQETRIQSFTVDEAHRVGYMRYFPVYSLAGTVGNTSTRKDDSLYKRYIFQVPQCLSGSASFPATIELVGVRGVKTQETNKGGLSSVTEPYAAHACCLRSLFSKKTKRRCN
jgi:hypothetical protein